MIEPSIPPESSSDELSQRTPGEGFKRAGEEVRTVLYEELQSQSVERNVVMTVCLLVVLSLSVIGVIVYFAPAGAPGEVGASAVATVPMEAMAMTETTKATKATKATKEDFVNHPKYKAGLEAFKEGQPDQAMELIESLEEKFGHLSEYFYARAMCAFIMGRRERARDDVLKALEIEPNLASALTLYGLVLHSERRWEEVIPVMEKVLGMNEKFTDAWFCLGSARRALGRTEEAEAALRKAIELEPGHAEGGWELALIYDEMGKSEEGLGILRGVVEVSPNNASSRYYLSKYLCRLGRLDEGLEHARTALALNGSRADFHGQLANVLRLRGETEESITEAETAMRLSGGATTYVFLLAQCYADAGKAGDSNMRLKQVLQSDPEHDEALTLLGKSLSGQDRLFEAIEYLEKAVEIAPDKAAAWEILAGIYEELGQFPKAENAKGKVAQLRGNASEG